MKLQVNVAQRHGGDRLASSTTTSVVDMSAQDGDDDGERGIQRPDKHISVHKWGQDLGLIL